MRMLLRKFDEYVEDGLVQLRKFDKEGIFGWEKHKIMD